MYYKLIGATHIRDLSLFLMILSTWTPALKLCRPGKVCRVHPIIVRRWLCPNLKEPPSSEQYHLFLHPHDLMGLPRSDKQIRGFTVRLIFAITPLVACTDMNGRKKSCKGTARAVLDHSKRIDKIRMIENRINSNDQLVYDA